MIWISQTVWPGRVSRFAGGRLGDG